MQSINGWCIKYTLLLFQQFSAMCVLRMWLTIKFRYVLLPSRSCVKFCLWLGNTWVRVLGGNCVQFCQHGNRSIKEQRPKQAFKMSFPRDFDVCVFISTVLQQQKNLEGYVGFASLPNQVYRKSVKRGFEFTLMVVGKNTCCCVCLCFYMNHFIVFIVVAIHKSSSVACVCLCVCQAVFIYKSHFPHICSVYCCVKENLRSF